MPLCCRCAIRHSAAPSGCVSTQLSRDRGRCSLNPTAHLSIVQPCARNSAISSRSGSDKYLPERGCADGPNIAGRMPPAFLNHRAPTACGTPAVAAASSLTKPAEIAAQNLLICSRFAIVGRPGDRKAARPERSDCRFHLFIAALSRRCDDHLNSLNTAVSSSSV